MALFDIKSFDGGVNNFVDPGQLPKNQSQNTVDAEINEGNLSSLNGLLQLNPILYTEPKDVNNHKRVLTVTSCGRKLGRPLCLT